MPRANDESRQFDVDIGLKIHEARIARGWSRQQLASKIDVTHQQLQKYEKGHNRVPPHKLKIIARIFQIPIAIMFNEDVVNLPDEHLRMGIEVSRNFLNIKNPIHQSAINLLVRTLSENQHV
jgi:transcriptional regulator with XRE-family HTH domain